MSFETLRMINELKAALEELSKRIAALEASKSATNTLSVKKDDGRSSINRSDR